MIEKQNLFETDIYYWLLDLLYYSKTNISELFSLLLGKNIVFFFITLFLQKELDQQMNRECFVGILYCLNSLFHKDLESYEPKIQKFVIQDEFLELLIDLEISEEGELGGLGDLATDTLAMCERYQYK